MNDRTRKSIAAAIPLIFVFLIAIASTAFAQREPLVVGGDGTFTNTDDLISSTTPNQLLETTVTLPDNPHSCLVVASADARFGGNGVYIFGLRADGLSTSPPVTSSTRVIEFLDTPDNDSSYLPVSTNYTFKNLTGTHTFRFSAFKDTASAANMTVAKSTLGVICFQKTL